MSNQCYLCCSPFQRLYPSFENEDYDPSVHTIASSVNVLPIAWLALFRQEDLVEATFDVDGDEIEQCAPLIARETALTRLEAARPRVEQAFEQKPDLAEHFALFAELFGETEEPWLTIELEEVECLWESPEAFRAALKNALAYLAGDGQDAQPLLELAGLSPNATIPSRERFSDAKCPREQVKAFYALLGAAATWE